MPAAQRWPLLQRSHLRDGPVRERQSTASDSVVASSPAGRCLIK